MLEGGNPTFWQEERLQDPETSSRIDRSLVIAKMEQKPVEEHKRRLSHHTLKTLLWY